MKQFLIAGRFLSLFMHLANLKEALGAISSCHANLIGNSGTFTSPNYSLEPSYETLQQRDEIICEWTIEVDQGKGIQLKFGDFNIDAPLDECDKGEVEIFSLTGKQRASLDKYCPGNSPDSALISNNTATVVFRRPASGFKGRGFLISYIATSPGETITDFITCSDTGDNHSEVESYTVTCPSGCASIDHQAVRGNLPYREDSHICRAAVHAGVISDEFGGEFLVKRESAMVSVFMGKTANNITALTGSMADFQFNFPSVESCHDEIKLQPSQYTASSYLNETTNDGRYELWLPQRALLTTTYGAWSPSDSTKPQWLQIDLGRKMNITGVLVRGSQKPYSWTKNFTVHYSNNNIFWHPYVEKNYQQPKLFAGNTNFYSTVRNNFVEPSIIARYVRIYPTPRGKRDFIPLGLKASLIGCDFTDDEDYVYTTSKRYQTAITTSTTKALISSKLELTSSSPATTTETKYHNEKEPNKEISTNSSKTKKNIDLVTTGNGNKKSDLPSENLNEKSIIIIAIVAVLAVTSILLATLVLFLVRKRRKVPKYMTAIPPPTSQNNITYHSPVGMPFAPSNNNIQAKKSKKTSHRTENRADETVALNGVSYANSFARDGATIPYDQACQPLVNGLINESRIPMGVSYVVGKDNVDANHLYSKNKGITSSFTTGIISFSDDDDHEYQVILDPVNEYNNKALSHSSDASNRSSIGAQSKTSDTNKWHQNFPSGSLKYGDSKEILPARPCDMHSPIRHVSSNSIHSQRKTPPLSHLNPSSAHFPLRSGNNLNTHNLSPHRFSNSSNGSSSPHNFNNSMKTFTPVLVTDEHPLLIQTSKTGTVFNHNQQKIKRHPPFIPHGDSSYPPVYSPTSNGHFGFHNNGHAPSISNGSSSHSTANNFETNVSSANRINERSDYDQLYRKKLSTEAGNSFVSMTTNNYDQLNLNTAV